MTVTPDSHADSWHKRLSGWAVTTCLAATLLCQFATNSLKATIGDATLFAYGGRLIVNGGVPYRDFWDNKPPGIFYIEALSYWLFGTTWLGPTITQAAVYLATIAAFAWAAKKLLPACGLQRSAFLVLLTLLINLPLFAMDGSNLTQDYVLLPTALALGLLNPLSHRPNTVRWAIAGGLAGLAFLIRPNALVIGWLAVLTLLLHQARPTRGGAGAPSFALTGLARWSPALSGKLLAAFALGGCLPILAVSAYFFSEGALSEMWFATLTYNVTAYQELFLNRPSLSDAQRYFFLEPRFGVSSLYVAGLVGCSCLWAARRRLPDAATSLGLIIFSVGWLLVDIVLVLATGHPYPHYVFMLIPSAALFGSTLFRPLSIGRFSAPWRGWLSWVARGLAVYVVVVVCSPLLVPLPEQIKAGIRRAAAPFPTTDQQLALFIRQVAEPRDPIMTLGHFHGHMMYLGNPSAVPVMSTFHLKSDYGNQRWTPQYIRALTEHPPKVVVITSGYWNPSKKRGPAPQHGRARNHERPKIERLVHEKYFPSVQRFKGRRVFLRKDLKQPSLRRTYIPAGTETTSWL